MLILKRLTKKRAAMLRKMAALAGTGIETRAYHWERGPPRPPGLVRRLLGGNEGSPFASCGRGGPRHYFLHKFFDGCKSLISGERLRSTGQGH